MHHVEMVTVNTTMNWARGTMKEKRTEAASAIVSTKMVPIRRTVYCLRGVPWGVGRELSDLSGPCAREARLARRFEKERGPIGWDGGSKRV